MEISKDLKNWYAIACPTTGVRFDLRTLQLMDTDGDGRVRSPEVQAALDYLKGKGVSPDELVHPSEEDAKKLADVLKRQAELDKAEPSELEKAAMAEWEAKGKTPEVAILGTRPRRPRRRSRRSRRRSTTSSRRRRTCRSSRRSRTRRCPSRST